MTMGVMCVSRKDPKLMLPCFTNNNDKKKRVCVEKGEVA